MYTALQVFDGDKKSEQPGAEELALLVEIFRNRAAHPSVEIEKKCEVLERCLECIQDLSSRYILPNPRVSLYSSKLYFVQTYCSAYQR
jgi:hypothetical protein